MKKDIRESVLWLLTAIPVVTLISWNCTVRWLTRKKYQASPIFQKTQNLDQICCFNEEKNDPTCFSDRFKAAKIFRGECSVRVDCLSHCYPDWVKLCCQMTSQQDVASSMLLPENQKLEQSCCCNEERNDPCVFLAGLRLQLSTLHSGKVLHLTLGYNSQVQKKFFSLQFQSWVKTLLAHNVTFHQKRDER